MDKTATEKSTDLLTLYDKTKKYVDLAYCSGLLFYLASMAMSFTRLNVFQVTYSLQILRTILLIIAAVYKVFFEFFRNWKKAIFALLIIVFGFICYYMAPNCELFPITAMALVGAIGVSADQVLIIGIIGNVIMIFNNIMITVTSSETTLQARDFFYLGNNEFSISQMNNFSCTDLAAHYLWIVAAYLWIRGKKLTWGEWFVLVFFDFVLYAMSGSNTAFLCIALCLFIAFCLKIQIAYFRKKKTDSSSALWNKIKKVFVSGCKYSFLILAAVCIALSALYNNNISFFRLLNRITNQRFSLAYRALIEHGVHLFASYVPSYGINSSADGFYNFIDCSYVNILIRYGIVLLVFYVAAMTFIQVKHRKYIYGACILTVLAISCIEEHHLVELPYNFFLILLFSDIDYEEKTDYMALIKRKKNNDLLINIVSALICLVLIGSFVYINIPRIMTIKEIERLDKKAGDIYLQIQTDIDIKLANGEWDKEVYSMNSSEYGDILSEPSDFTNVTGAKWSEAISNPKRHSFYSVRYDPASDADYDVLDLMISDEVKAMVGNGSLVIEYDVVSGRIYSVWFADTSGCHTIEGGRWPGSADRLSVNVPIREGYYAG